MEIAVISISFFITHLVAKYIGEKRKIGYRRTIIWCLLLSPVAGTLIALGSRKLETET